MAGQHWQQVWLGALAQLESQAQVWLDNTGSWCGWALLYQQARGMWAKLGRGLLRVAKQCLGMWYHALHMHMCGWMPHQQPPCWSNRHKACGVSYGWA